MDLKTSLKNNLKTTYSELDIDKLPIPKSKGGFGKARQQKDLYKWFETYYDPEEITVEDYKEYDSSWIASREFNKQFGILKIYFNPFTTNSKMPVTLGLVGSQVPASFVDAFDNSISKGKFYMEYIMQYSWVKGRDGEMKKKPNKNSLFQSVEIDEIVMAQKEKNVVPDNLYEAIQQPIKTFKGLINDPKFLEKELKKYGKRFIDKRIRAMEATKKMNEKQIAKNVVTSKAMKNKIDSANYTSMIKEEVKKQAQINNIKDWKEIFTLEQQIKKQHPKKEFIKKSTIIVAPEKKVAKKATRKTFLTIKKVMGLQQKAKNYYTWIQAFGSGQLNPLSVLSIKLNFKSDFKATMIKEVKNNTQFLSKEKQQLANEIERQKRELQTNFEIKKSYLN